MPIFNERVLQKHIPKVTTIPEQELEVIEGWIQQIKSGSLAKQTEVAIQAPFTNQIMVKLLGYTTYGQSERWNISREYGVAGGAVDLALGHFGANKEDDVVVAPFELKGAKTRDLDAIMSGRHKTPVQQAWDYARDLKGVEWVLLSNYVELRLYAVSETSLVYEQFYFENLLDIKEYSRFKLLLSPENLLGGRTKELLNESLEAEKEISARLYDDYKHLRESMLITLISDNPSCSPEELISPAQKLLDRVLFLAFAEDKGLIPNTTIKKAYEHSDPYNPRPVYQNFIGLFNAIDKGNKSLDIPAYNGGLFAKDDSLDGLVVSDSLCEGFKDLAEYDFDSEVSVTVLGHIFEQSIEDLEELTQDIQSGEIGKVRSRAKAKAVSGKRKKDGVVYTPDNITQFIVVNTLGSHISEQFEILFEDYGKYKKDGSIQWKKGVKTELKFWYAWQEKLREIKVVDPACGSGAFLVAAFDCLYSEYEKVNERIAELTGQRGILDLNKEILNNNIYGVDINDESIEITKLSIWLKTAERGKHLESLDSNFLSGNSLGFDIPTPDSSFVWKEHFKDIFDKGGFDVVLGNPPYVRQELFGDLKSWLEGRYEVYHGVLDLYGYFFELGVRLLSEGGRMAYISNSTFFKTNSSIKLRKYLSTQASIEKIVDFGDLQVFEGVTTYPAIVVLQKRQPQINNRVEILPLKGCLPENILMEFERNKDVMDHRQLGHSGWQLESKEKFELKQKLTRNCRELRDVYGSPYRGLLTGFNDAFVIDLKTKNEIIAKDPKSNEIIKPFLEGKDLKKWRAEPRDIFVIFTRRGIDIDQYFGVKEYLERYKDRLQPKTKNWDTENKGKKWTGRKSGPYKWYEIQDTVAYHLEFEKPKIQYGHFSPESLFHYNTSGSYSNDKTYIIPTNDLFLYGLLNSSVYWYLIKSICPFVRGGFYEVRAQYIEKLPIPEKPSDERISTIASSIQVLAEKRYKCEKGFLRRLEDLESPDQEFKLSKKLQSWWLLNFSEFQKEIKKSFKGVIPLAERNDWQDYFESEKSKIEDLGAEISMQEKELNKQVYTLFNLTDDEISLIEQGL